MLLAARRDGGLSADDMTPAGHVDRSAKRTRSRPEASTGKIAPRRSAGKDAYTLMKMTPRPAITASVDRLQGHEVAHALARLTSRAARFEEVQADGESRW
jgi:hypothetical protein